MLWTPMMWSVWWTRNMCVMEGKKTCIQQQKINMWEWYETKNKLNYPSFIQ